MRLDTLQNEGGGGAHWPQPLLSQNPEKSGTGYAPLTNPEQKLPRGNNPNPDLARQAIASSPKPQA